MTNERNEGFNWWSLILGIIYLILAYLAWTTPLLGTATITFVFAFAAIFRGIMLISIRNRVQEHTNVAPNGMMILGIIDIILGVIILFNTGAAIISVPYVFAIWFIIDSIGSIIVGWNMKERTGRRYWSAIILGVIGIILGIMMFRNPLATVMAVEMIVALYFLISGIGMIIDAF